MSRKKIPNRWENYSNIGSVIEGTSFIPFKVPLNNELSLCLPNNVKQFRPSDILKYFMDRNLRVGLIIDLTNTSKYYSPQEFQSYEISYVKLFTEGHAVPSPRICQQFFQNVDDFLSRATDYNLIGVHCTHGVNRTGYLICRYMIDKLHISPQHSINAFTKARGHPIERGNYLSALFDPAHATIYQKVGDDGATTRLSSPPPGNDESPTNEKQRRPCYRRKPNIAGDIPYGRYNGGNTQERTYGNDNYDDYTRRNNYRANCYNYPTSYRAKYSINAIGNYRGNDGNYRVDHRNVANYNPGIYNGFGSYGGNAYNYRGNNVNYRVNNVNYRGNCRRHGDSNAWSTDVFINGRDFNREWNSGKERDGTPNGEVVNDGELDAMGNGGEK